MIQTAIQTLVRRATQTLTETLPRQCRHSLRTLRRQPGFATLTIVTLGLGIAASVTLFSVLDSVLWRPLPFPESDRLVSVLEGGPGDEEPTSPAVFHALRELDSLRQVTATYFWTPVLRGGDRPHEVRGLAATPELFELLQSQALRGQTFELSGDEDDSENGRENGARDEVAYDHRVVVLSHDLWQRSFGGDPAIVGSSLSLDGEPYEVVGVMPQDFAFPTFWAEGAQLWARLAFTPEQATSSSRMLRVFARLDDGASLEAAQAEVSWLARRLQSADPEGHAGMRLQVSPLLEPTVGDMRTALWVLFAMVGVLLAITCANVAGLFLARGARRRRESAVRLALGARRPTLLAEHLVESLLLTSLGGALGLLLGSWAVDALVAYGPESIPRLAEVELHGRAVAFTAALVVVGGFVFGLTPLLGIGRRRFALALSAGLGHRGAPSSNVSSSAARRTLVVAEITLTVLLLAGAGLLGRSFHHLSSFDPGLARDRVLTLRLSLEGTDHAPPEAQTPFYDQVLAEIEAVPGVRAVGLVNHLPVGDDIWSQSFRLEGRPEPEPGQSPGAVVRVASPGLFDALGLRLAAGRTFDDRDRADGEQAVMVNRTLAETYFPGEDPVGRRIVRGSDDGRREWTIVGVVDDVRQWRLTDEVKPETIFPYAQNPLAFWAKSSLVVRTDIDPVALARTIQDRLWRLEPDLSVSNVRPMDTVLADTVSETRFQAFALALFALLALVLSAVGLYGVMSYLVAWRRTDIGVRMALGADRRQILGWVLADGLKLAFVGVALGLTLAVVAGGALSSLLHGIDAGDPPTLAAAGATILLITASATYLPALRAARLDPLECLRDE